MTVALDIRGLRTEFRIGGAWVPAVRDLSLALRQDETLAVVGESGSGKSVTALSVMRLLAGHNARIAAGRVFLGDQDLLALSERAMSRVRGNAIGMIFQEPMTSLNPTMTVGDQIAEAITLHRDGSRGKALAEAARLLEEVRIPAARQRLGDYPHQFSGGMRQRVMIAMAIACRPAVLLADEPTTALDVTVQAQVLLQLAELRRSHGMSVLFITHNLGVVAQVADRVAVLYAGEVVELGPAEALLTAPRHPYTAALLRAVPRADRDAGELDPIPGAVPPLTDMPSGCAFAPRCAFVQPRCVTGRPSLRRVGQEHEARCVLVGEEVT
jgi:peptide/nickel transport system ATP-binding protein